MLGWKIVTYEKNVTDMMTASVVFGEYRKRRGALFCHSMVSFDVLTAMLCFVYLHNLSCQTCSIVYCTFCHMNYQCRRVEVFLQILHCFLAV